jgi:hypothetical protein
MPAGASEYRFGRSEGKGYFLKQFDHEANAHCGELLCFFSLKIQVVVALILFDLVPQLIELFFDDSFHLLPFYSFVNVPEAGRLLINFKVSELVSEFINRLSVDADDP